MSSLLSLPVAFGLLLLSTSTVAFPWRPSARKLTPPPLAARWDDDRDPTLWARADVLSPPGSKFDIRVRLEFEGFLDGTGTFIKVKVDKGLYGDERLGNGHYAFHIHTNPIGSDGNCTAALAHLDPYQVTEGFTCDPAFPAFCQEGDLSGKHGKLNGTDTGVIESFAFTDDYVRFFPQEFSLLGRSIVVHEANKTRIACGNIVSPLDGTADGKFNPTGSPSTYNPPSSLPKKAFPQPETTITPINGTVYPSQSYLDSLPFPWPFKALSIRESLNVKLTTGTTSAGKTMPSAVSDSAASPFQGSVIGLWGLTW